MLSRVITSALFAGAAAGLTAGILQLVFVQPVLLHAELYETGALVHFGSASTVPAAQDVARINPLRDGLSVLFSMLTYFGFALMLVAGMAFAGLQGAETDARSGILWGLGGFVVFQFAPGFSLAPEVPGVAAGDLAGRQVWWFATVAATAVGLWLIAFGRSWLAWGFAILLLLAPHIVGAPEPEVFAGPAPPEIGATFAARAFGVGMAAWVILGCLAGYFWSRNGQPENVARSG